MGSPSLTDAVISTNAIEAPALPHAGPKLMSSSGCAPIAWVVVPLPWAPVGWSPLQK